MHKRLRTLAMLGALVAALSMGTPVSAGARIAPPPDSYVTQQATTCTDEYNALYQGGNFYDPSGVARVDYVSAFIDPTVAGFQPCSGGFDPLGINAPSVWVAIAPDANSPQYNNPNAILQLGIVKCDYGQAYCDYPYNRIFWARGGCGAYGPSGIDLGRTDHESHRYLIQQATVTGGGIVWQGWVDNDKVFEIPVGHESVGCWANQSDRGTRAYWMGELFDGGDSWSNADDKLNFTTLYRSVVGSGVVQQTWSGDTACNFPAEDSDVSDHKCDRTNSNGMDLWSVPG